MTMIKPATTLALSLCVTLFAFFATGCYSQGAGISWGGGIRDIHTGTPRPG